MRNFYSFFKLLIAVVFGIFYSVSSSAQECNIIYITPTGASSGVAGTKAIPANLTYGLTLVTPTDNQLWLATGTYPISNTLLIPSNVTIEGGFNSATWIKSNVSQSIIDKDASNVLPSPFDALIGLAGNSVSNFRLQDITVNVANAPGNGISVYGIYLSGCSNYNITRCLVTTGSGSPGIAGTSGIAGTTGGNGGAGVAGGPEGLSYPGGTGGTGGNTGGNGATVLSYDNCAAGIIGAGICGGAGGSGGTGPSCSLGCAFGNPGCSGTTPGQPGLSGGNGTAGTNGTIGSAGSIIGGYFVVGSIAGNGGNGTDGCGGGGGGAGGGQQESGSDDWGGSGGGGGGGGFSGTGGTGGSGGGGSFAVFLDNNGVGGIIQDCFLNPGSGGAGGNGGGGSVGGAGGAGGTGGAGGVCSAGNGGTGGTGGTGGAGGTGGVGATGLSMALSENGGTPISNLGIISVPGNPPVISVANKGCTNSEVLFTSTTAGNWNFGTGASPATATGTGPFSVYYSSLGRKTIVHSGTNFTDYVNIFQAGPTIPSITPSNGSVILGCPNTFTTSLTGTYYEWIFGSVASPDTVQGATMQTANNIYFFAPGTYIIHLYVTTACCGRVHDSTTVTVTPSSFNVSLASSPSPICQGDAITFTASPSTYSGYQFFVNNIPVQSGASNIYTTTTIQTGDSIVVIALSGTCFTNPSATIYPIVNPIPLVSLSSSASPSNTICTGTSVTFTASPTGYANYEFFNGAASIQNGAGNTFTTTTLVPGNSITVIATDNGCPSLPSNAIVTNVDSLPVVTLTSSDANNQICTGDNVTFTATPAGYANYEFFDGVTSLQNGASNIYSTTSLINGNSITVVATSSGGCVGLPSNAIVTGVNPIPTATLSSSDSNDTICQNESITFTSTPSGYSTYAFYNGATLLQTGSANTFTTNALAAGNSITVIASNSGCSSPASNAITISIIPAPVVNAGTDFQVCFDASPVTLSGFTPSGGTWTGSGTSPTGVFNPSSAGAGSHQLLYAVTNSNNCTGYDTLIATVDPMPVVVANSASICTGESAILTASGANTYVWSPATGLSSTTGSSVTANPSVTTTYTIIGTSTAGCKDTTNVVVTVNSIEIVNITGNTAINSCETTELTAVPTDGTYTWGPDVNLSSTSGATVTAAPASTQQYWVTYTSPQGCVDSDTVTVVVTDINTYFLPTGLTPNGDGINDEIHLHGRGIESFSLKIFDRIGEQVFQTTSMEKGWNGRLLGVPMNDGVFVYILNITFCNGEKVKKEGDITLVK